jgi:hypothetical protein
MCGTGMRILCEEYLYPDDGAELTFFYDDLVEEVMGLVEAHFDGWLVEQPEENINTAVATLTQHWRYERFWGFVINSWQIEPIEQPGATDGDHTGDNPWGS